MRTLYLLVVIYSALILSACANNISNPALCATPVKSSMPDVPSNETLKPAPTTASNSEHHKDPMNVSFLNINKLNRPYDVIGLANVEKYNGVGIKRQEATLRDLMREQAAKLDGDAIIEIENNDKVVSAKVIAYKKALV